MALANTLATTMALFAMAEMVHAADYRTEYVKKINASQNIGVLGDSLGGDRINLFTGSAEFEATDVSIPGNFALPVSVGRRYGVGRLGNAAQGRAVSVRVLARQ